MKRAWIMGAIALVGCRAADEAPTATQAVCADYILAASDWQDGVTTDDEFRERLLEVLDDATGTDVEDDLRDAIVSVTAAGPDGAVPELRALGQRCGDILPD